MGVIQDDGDQTSMALDVPAKQGQETIFVVGLGMVGCAFIEKMLDRDETKRYRLVTASEESYYPYNRVGLTEYFEHRSADKLFLQPPEWFAKHSPEHFSYYIGEKVTEVDTAAKVVTTSKGRNVKYDHCVFSTGSAATFPPYLSDEEVAKTEGIFVYRSIGDLESILDYGEKDQVKHAVVVGGGLLGLEAAKAVYDMPSIPEVSIINRQAYPLSRQLDADAGELVLRKIEQMGVKVLTNMDVHRITSRTEEDGHQVFTGFELSDGSILEADLVIFAIGIRSRDEIAAAAGINCHSRGGIVVDDDLQTSSEGVYAIGECCNWRGNTYGLIAPGVEMADLLSFNLTQTKTSAGTFKPRKMNPPDLSTKLKLMGVDVASFGDFFADRDAEEKRRKSSSALVKKVESDSADEGVTITERPSAEAKRRKFDRALVNHDRGPVLSLTYKDPFDSVYKKYIFSSDGKHLLGGMMVGDVADFVKLVAIVKKKKPLDVQPSQFIMGTKKAGEADGDDLDDDTQICSCHNVSKGTITQCVKDGMTGLGDIKTKTKAGTACGGCQPLLTSIFKSEMKKSGKEVSNHLCPHFAMPRGDLFKVIKVKKLKTWLSVMQQVSTNPTSVGCELCKPAVASIFATLWSEHVMDAGIHGAQDTNDKFMANIQRDGSYSVVPRVAGGEILPEHLIVIGQVAKDYSLYTKITGGQRIDMFGAQKEDLPDIWSRLVAAGMESGQAYGKALRTVKSCVGTTWCRFGLGDSVGLAVQLENRYKGIRSPHKFKSGVSGCVRECAEAQSKDFGLIAGDKGWNIFVGGNGGANPVHAKLLATNVPPTKVVTIIDRYLMLYIQTANKLERTARWLESFDGGVERLKSIILEDSLGICADLDSSMQQLIAGYQDEWTTVVKDESRRKQFRKFANTGRTAPEAERISERGQKRPADWGKFKAHKFKLEDFATPKDQWQWRSLAKMADLSPEDSNQTSVAVRYGDTQLAIFRLPNRGLYASQQMCPHKRAFVLEHGLLGDDGNDGVPYVSCPMHKRNFSLQGGECINDEDYSIITFDVKHDEETDDILLLLPDTSDMDAVLGTSKWMVTQAKAEAAGLGASGKLEIEEKVVRGPAVGEKGCDSGGVGALAW